MNKLIEFISQKSEMDQLMSCTRIRRLSLLHSDDLASFASFLTYHGPTVNEITLIEIREIDRKIEELQSRKQLLKKRLNKYPNKMLEAERIATETERYL